MMSDKIIIYIKNSTKNLKHLKIYTFIWDIKRYAVYFLFQKSIYYFKSHDKNKP